MATTDNKAARERWLLPEGIEEILPDEARRLETLRRHLLDLFASWGYELVMPPLIEYLDSLLTGTGSDLDLQTFKLTDQLTGRLMGVRPDMTPQAARIDAHYLKRRAPVRLCYVGSVLRTRPDEFEGAREPLQIGAELFGHEGPEADAEILSLMIEALRVADIRQAHIDLGHIGVFRALARQVKFEDEGESELFAALQRKARDEVESLLAECDAPVVTKRMLSALLDLCGGHEVLSEARTRLKGAPPAVKQALTDLETLAERVSRRPGTPTLYFDFAELSGYRYYTGAVFSAFVPGHGRAIARGGRYDGIGKAFGRGRPATGFGTDLRRWLRLSDIPTSQQRGILAPDSDDPNMLAEVAHLRAHGERVVMWLPGEKCSASELGCDRLLARKDGRWVVDPIK